MRGFDEPGEFCALLACDRERLRPTWHLVYRDELRRIVEFIQSGGLVEERAQEIADLERQKRELEGHAVAPCGMGSTYSPGDNYGFWRIGIAAAAIFLRILLRR
jgi:hypothetical protein